MTLPVPRDGSPGTARASIGERFERLPFTRYQTKLVVVLATCYLVDAADLNLLAYLLAPVSQDLGWSGGEAGLAAAAVFAGMAIGATVAGAIADKFGRRNVLVWSMVLWGTASLATAFAWDLQSFITFRVITGLGLGAELPVAFTLLAELVPAGRRARLTGWIVLSGAAGGVIFNLLALGAVAIFGPNIGWRVMFGIMFLIAALAMYVRRSLPESPRWFESRADHDRADQAMKVIEQNVERAYGQPLPEPVPAPEPDVIEEDHTRPRASTTPWSTTPNWVPSLPGT